jgi:2'-5' RNA ligase
MPEAITAALAPVLAALPVGRIVPPENLHLTLAFLGNVPEPLLEEVHFALDALRHPGFDLTLAGLETFGGARPLSLHIVAAPDPALTALHRRIRSRLHGLGLALERRRFAPHVTIARFARAMGPEEAARIGRFLAAHADLRLAPFRATAFCLCESILTEAGAHYEVLARYPLTASG